jgi:hypothetical protein
MIFMPAAIHPSLPARPAWLRLVAMAALLAPCCIVFIATWPGLYTVDSLKQLRQALTGEFGDFHPPIISGLWSVLIRATGEPGSLLIFQIAFLAIGLLIWMRYFSQVSLAATCLFLVVVAWNPIVTSWAGVFCKDSPMAFALLAGFALAAFLTAGSKRPWTLLAAILLLATYALGARWNALAAVLPLFYLCALHLVKVVGWRRHVIAATLTLILSTLAIVINMVLAYGLLRAERDPIYQILFLHDLAAIQTSTGQDVIPRSSRIPTSAPGT